MLRENLMFVKIGLFMKSDDNFIYAVTGVAGKEEINVTMELPYEWNSTKCGLTGCEKISFFACIHFQASTDVFPKIR
jgi:hypothetical protein